MIEMGGTSGNQPTRSQLASGLRVAGFAKGFFTLCGVLCVVIATGVAAVSLARGDFQTALFAAGMVGVGIGFTVITRRAMTGFTDALRGDQSMTRQVDSGPEFAPLQGVVDGVPYQADSLSHGNVEVWIDLPQDQMRLPQLFFETRSGLADPAAAEWGAEQIQALFGLGATDVDVGYHSDCIQVCFPWEHVAMTHELIERAVTIMIELKRLAIHLE